MRLAAENCVEESIHLGLLQRHRLMAAAHLVKGALHVFDATVGDAGCAMRASFALDMYWELKNNLHRDDFSRAESCAERLIALSKGMRPDTKVKTEEDLGALRTPFDDFYVRSCLVLGEQNIRHLGLCYSLTVSNKTCLDEFGTAIYTCWTSLFSKVVRVSSLDANKPQPQNRLPELQSELSQKSVEYIGRTTRRNISPRLEGTIEAELVSSLQSMRRNKQHPSTKQNTDILLLAMYPQIQAIVTHETARQRPLILVIRRIAIQRAHNGQLRYKLLDARCLYYKVSQNTKQWLICSPPDGDVSSRPCLTINCWNTFFEDPDTNNDQYFSELSRSPINDLLLSYAAVHPPFEAHNNEKDFALMFKLDDQYPKLLEEWRLRYFEAKARDVVGVRLVTEIDSRRERIDRAVDFSIEHISVSTFKEAKAYCAFLKNRQMDPDVPTIGQLVGRFRSVGVSLDKVAVGNFQPETLRKRLQRYVKMHDKRFLDRKDITCGL